jgi:UDP-N-acetylmuramyl-tripeptide synthetase
VKLSDMLKAIREWVVTPPAQPAGRRSAPDPEIASLHYDSREVQPGGMFVAIRGLAADGHVYIGDAVQRGAAAVVMQQPTPAGDAVAIRVTDSRRALAALAAEFYGQPSRKLCVVGVTGTNGKTTTAALLESILAEAGLRVGVIGTINYRYGGSVFDSPVTTPESLDLQRLLVDMAAAGVSHVVMEVSSHALALGRVRNCWFDAAVFTNLSQDHLDFHHDMATYWSTKRQLFADYLVSGPKSGRAVAVINCGDRHGAELALLLKIPLIRIGPTTEDDVRAENAVCDREGIHGWCETPGGGFTLRSGLAGRHNLENILCAAGAAVALKLSPQIAARGIAALKKVPGRLERIENQCGRYVYVDYAHTPDALENVLNALRALSSARVVCIFGCGGDRDRAKRPMMGAIANRLCDLAVVTSDNPRSEDPVSIIEQILPGSRGEGAVQYRPETLAGGFEHRGYVVEPDRRRAIELGLRASRAGDTVLIAGKGHETYQIVKTGRVDFDDRLEARRVLTEMSREAACN